jgi:TonB-dependent receptor
LAWYFNEGSYVFGDVFYKKINDSIANTEALETFNGQTYRIQMPTNANKGMLRGIELGYQQFFRNLPGWLSGFGLKANYTYVDSSVNGILPDFQTSLPDLSKNSYNLILLYDSDHFWARVAWNWRSSFFAFTRASALGTVPIYDNGYGILDASVGYNFTPHVSVSLNGVNLSDTRRTSYYLRSTLPNEMFQNARRVQANLRVTF